MGAGGGSQASLGAKFPSKPGQIKHIFSDREGHVPDTLENRKLILETVNNRKNYRGTDQWGLDNYSQELADGQQVWARVNNGVVDDAGINRVERPWDNDTGFKLNPEKD
jgi:filamentous hemagglutinin